MNFISVYERLPEVNGHGVLGVCEISGEYTILGTVRLTTDHGNVYKGTANDGEPVWELWAPHFGGVVLIGPDDISHWAEIPNINILYSVIYKDNYNNEQVSLTTNSYTDAIKDVDYVSQVKGFYARIEVNHENV